MKKLLALLLVLLIGGSAIACSGGGNNPAASTSGESPSTVTDDGRIADYDGFGFVLYCRSCCQHAEYIYPESDSPDIVDVAALRRNDRVRELVNAVICEPVVEDDGYPQNLVAQLQSDDIACDAVIWHRYYLATLAQEGYLSNLAKYDGFNFDEDYWATDIINNYSYNGITFFADGHYTTDMLSDIGCVLFNEKIFADKFGNDDTLYETVGNGSWTLDKLAQYIDKGASDLDGDGAFIPGDQFGMIISRQHLFQFQSAADQYAVDRDESGTLSYVLYTDRMANIVNKVYDFVIGTSKTYMIESAEQARDLFSNGNSLLTTTALRDLTWESLRNMADGYGVLPFPKYDESQKEYRSRLFAHSSLLGLPYNVEDGERSAVILDVMAKVGYEDVTPVFYESALKNKYTSKESWEMLDLLVKGLTSDFGDVISWAPVYTLDDLVGVKKSKDFASYYQQNEEGVMECLKETLLKLEKYADR